MRIRPALLISLALALACSRSETEVEKTETTTIADDRPKVGGTLVRRLVVDITSLNPVLADSRYESYIANYLFTPLVRLSPNLEAIPGLAESWVISDDGLLYRFTLNEKATFADGTPVRAGDVLFTLRKLTDPTIHAPQFSSFEHLDLQRTRVIDDHTIEVAFRKSLATQLTRFSDVLIVPEAVYSKGDFAKDFNETAIGSGPYKLAKRRVGKDVVLERRSDYWGDPVYIQTVILKYVEAHATAWNALKLGELDETLIASDVWLRERNNPSLTSYIDFQRFYTLSYNFIAWNGSNPLLSDKRIRRALSMCVPIESVVQDLYHGTARAMSGPFTPDEWAYNPTVPVIRYNPDEAKRLFASVGWLDKDGDGVLEKDGKKFVLELTAMTGSAATDQFTQMVQAELKKIGVKLDIRMMDGAIAIDEILAGKYTAAYMSWDLDPDPDPYALFHSSQVPPVGRNFVYYSNPEADRLMEEGRTLLDIAKRKEIYWRLHEILAEDQPYTWTVQVSLKWGINKRVRGVQVSRGYGLFLWYPGELGWWIQPQVPAGASSNP